MSTLWSIAKNNGDSWKQMKKLRWCLKCNDFTFHITCHSERTWSIFIADSFCIFFWIYLSWQSVRVESKEDQKRANVSNTCSNRSTNHHSPSLMWYPTWSNQSRWNSQSATHVNEWHCSELIESWVMTQQSVEHLGESVHNGRELVLLLPGNNIVEDSITCLTLVKSD